MRFGLFGSAQAKRGGSPNVDSGAGFRDFVDYNMEAEQLGYHSTFIVETTNDPASRRKTVPAPTASTRMPPTAGPTSCIANGRTSPSTEFACTRRYSGTSWGIVAPKAGGNSASPAP